MQSRHTKKEMGWKTVADDSEYIKNKGGHHFFRHCRFHAILRADAETSRRSLVSFRFCCIAHLG